MMRKNGNVQSNNIEATLRQLKHLQPFELEWIDASESEVASITPPLPDHNVETRHSEIGWLVTLQRGAAWRRLHLVYMIRGLDMDAPTKRYKIESIPIELVMRVRPLAEKEALKVIKARNNSVLDKRTQARPRHHRRHVQRFADGSVKYVD